MSSSWVWMSYLIYCYAECHQAESECHFWFIVMMNVIMLIVVILNVVMLSSVAPNNLLVIVRQQRLVDFNVNLSSQKFNRRLFSLSFVMDWNCWKFFWIYLFILCKKYSQKAFLTIVKLCHIAFSTWMYSVL